MPCGRSVRRRLYASTANRTRISASFANDTGANDGATLTCSRPNSGGVTMSHPHLINGILRRLPKADYLQIEPFFEPVKLELRQELITPGVAISHVWFPESGICSVIAATGGSEAIEVGMVGMEGMTDHLTKAGDISLLKSIVQMPGTALRV